MSAEGQGSALRRKTRQSRRAQTTAKGPSRSRTLPATARTGSPDMPFDGATTEIARLTLAELSPRSRISPHFRLHELTRSEVAARHGIDNSFPSDDELRAAVYLVREVLEPIREEFGAFSPNSVFRSQALERALKSKPSTWISTSQHTKGEACDVEIPGRSTLALAEWARDNLPAYDQIICECYDEAKGPNSGWVHISLVAPERGVNRRDLLSYIKDPVTGRMIYVQGLRGSRT